MDRIVDIATDGHHLSAHRGFLMVEKNGVEIGRAALDDIHAVIVHAHGVTWSGTLVARLAERGAPIVFCGTNHSPVAVTLPLEGHHAQAARRYWPLLMGADFRRNRDAAGANALLNYGYAGMRAACARAVVAAGLHPTVGIQHSNRGNAFALADDLVEPFRPLVDAVAGEPSIATPPSA